MRKRGFLLPVILFLAGATALAQPSKVALTAPADNANSVALAPTFGWSPATDAITYELQIARRSNMKQKEVDVTGVTGTSYTLSGELDESTTYYWRVRAIGDANGPWSDVWSFTTGLLPGATALSSPANQETGVALQPELVWQDANGATSYEVELSAASDFSSMVYSQSGIAGTTLTVPMVLDNETRYYWHVKSSNGVGEGPVSGTNWFETIVSAPDQVLLSAPADGATGIGTTPTFSWASTTGADSYGLEVSTSSGFATLLLQVDGITATSYNTPTPFPNGTVLFWRVRASNVAGDGPDSSIREFSTVAGGPTQVQLVSPANESVDVVTSPTLVWGAVQDAATYRVQVSTMPDLSSQLIYDTAVGGTQFDGRASRSQQDLLLACPRVKCRLRELVGCLPFCNDHGTARASDARCAGGQCGGSAAGTNVDLDGAIRAETYNLQVGLNPDFSVILLSETGLTSTGRTLEGLDPLTEYYWRVQGENSLGVGPWSSGRKFTTRMLVAPAEPVLIYPPDAAAGVSMTPVLAWNETEGADSYKLELSTSPPDEFENFPTVITAVVVTQPFFQSPALSPGQEHYWRVEARNEEGSTPSQVWRFRTTVATSSESDELPATFGLHQNYPNPFNPSTKIRYDVPETADVRLTVFDALGRPVETLGTWHRAPGTYSVRWDARDAPSGVYFVRMEAGSYVATRRMLLVR